MAATTSHSAVISQISWGQRVIWESSRPCRKFTHTIIAPRDAKISKGNCVVAVVHIWSCVSAQEGFLVWLSCISFLVQFKQQINQRHPCIVLIGIASTYKQFIYKHSDYITRTPHNPSRWPHDPSAQTGNTRKANRYLSHTNRRVRKKNEIRRSLRIRPLCTSSWEQSNYRTVNNNVHNCSAYKIITFNSDHNSLINKLS